MIRILLADDQALLRAGFRALLEHEDDMTVVGEAGDGLAAVQAIRELRPDVALIDVQMPRCDGIDVVRRVSADEELAHVHLVILTNYALDEYVFAALRSGASGFLVKDTEPEDLLHAIRVAARGEALLSPSITRRLIDEFAARSVGTDAVPGLDVLTNREREVMTLVAHGLSNDEIADRLFISHTTAKTHVSRVMTKLNARDRAQLVVFAYELGLVRPRRR